MTQYREGIFINRANDNMTGEVKEVCKNRIFSFKGYFLGQYFAPHHPFNQNSLLSLQSTWSDQKSGGLSLLLGGEGDLPPEEDVLEHGRDVLPGDPVLGAAQSWLAWETGNSQSSQEVGQISLNIK